MNQHKMHDTTRRIIRRETWHTALAAVYRTRGATSFLAATQTEDELVWYATLHATRAAIWWKGATLT